MNKFYTLARLTAVVGLTSVAHAQTLQDFQASSIFNSQNGGSPNLFGAGYIDYSGPNGITGSADIIASTDPSVSVTANPYPGPEIYGEFVDGTANLSYSFEVVWTGAGELPANSYVPINIQGSLFGTAAKIGDSDAQINTVVGSAQISGTGAIVPFDFSGSVAVDDASTIGIQVSAYSSQGFSVTDTVDPLITIDTNPADWQGSVDPNNYTIIYSPDLAP